MKSDHPTEAISAYMDGNLAPDETEVLEKHLAGCHACAHLLDDLRRLETAHEEPPQVPAGLQQRIARNLGLARVVPIEPPPPTVRPWLRGIPMAAAATMAAVVLLAVLIGVEPERIEAPGHRPRQAPAQQIPRTDAPKSVDEEPLEESFAVPESSTAATRDEQKKGLESIGYVGEGKDLAAEDAKGPGQGLKESDAVSEAEEPAPEPLQKMMREQAPSPTFAPVPPTVEEKSAGKVESSRSDKDEPVALVDELDSPETRRMSGLHSNADDAGERTLVVDTADYTIILSETGRLRLTAGEYDCTVVPTGEAGSTIASLFGSEAGQSGDGRRLRTLNAPASPEQRVMIMDSIRDGYSELLRKQCGPLPEALEKAE